MKKGNFFITFALFWILVLILIIAWNVYDTAKIAKLEGVKQTQQIGEQCLVDGQCFSATCSNKACDKYGHCTGNDINAPGICI